MRSQEKSAAMAFSRKRWNNSRSSYNTSALRIALARACDEYSWNLIPSAFSASSRTSMTVSSSPPVAQTVHLVQPARLEPRRHQEKIAAGLDAVRKSLVETDAHAHLGGEPAGQV